MTRLCLISYKADYRRLSAVTKSLPPEMEQEGLLAWQQHHPDIIISDIDMPVMNGFQMVERIRETDGDTPIVFASALTSPKDVREGYKIGVNNYIKKPFVPDELDAHIHGLLKMKDGAKTRNESGYYKIGSVHTGCGTRISS